LIFRKHIREDKSDLELAGLYKTSGKQELLGILYQRYMDLVYGVCLKYLQNQEDAKDAVLDIYEELVSKLLKYTVTNFKSWLYQLAKNHCLMKLRQKKSGPVNIDADNMQLEEKEHLDYDLDIEAQYSKMEFCLGQLGADQRKIIELFYLQHKCYKEIGVVTGMELNKVRSFIQNGRRNLKLCMDKSEQKA